MANATYPKGFVPVSRRGNDVKVRKYTSTSNGTNILYVGGLFKASAGAADCAAVSGASDVATGVVVGIYDANGIAVPYVPLNTATYTVLGTYEPTQEYRGIAAGTLTVGTSYATSALPTATTYKRSQQTISTTTTNGICQVLSVSGRRPNTSGENQEVVFKILAAAHTVG